MSDQTIIAAWINDAVLDELREAKRPCTTMQLANAVGCNARQAGVVLKRLEAEGEVRSVGNRWLPT